LVDRVEGVESLITFSKSQKTNWTTVVIIPISSLIKGVVYVKYVLILFGILSMGLSFVIAKMLSKRITKPIRNMQKAMKKVEKGNLDVVIPLTNTYEMNEFSNSFNHMIIKSMKKKFDAGKRS
jgi:two-component system sensor histidine kinase YesM